MYQEGDQVPGLIKVSLLNLNYLSFISIFSEYEESFEVLHIVESKTQGSVLLPKETPLGLIQKQLEKYIEKHRLPVHSLYIVFNRTASK